MKTVFYVIKVKIRTFKKANYCFCTIGWAFRRGIRF